MGNLASFIPAGKSKFLLHVLIHKGIFKRYLFADSGRDFQFLQGNGIHENLVFLLRISAFFYLYKSPLQLFFASCQTDFPLPLFQVICYSKKNVPGRRIHLRRLGNLLILFHGHGF